MGGEVSKLVAQNEPVPSERNYERGAPKVSQSGEVHMLIVALDYKRTDNALTCSIDGKNMEKLASQCGVRDLVAMYDEECTRENVLAAITDVGGRCGEDDYFVFYYSGHGTQVDDSDGDEDEGQDEALCLVDPQGQISYDTLLIDDDLAEALTDNVDENVRIIVLTDCCHSGTICDFDKDIWEGREAISIAGCLDSQTSGDIGKGGIFTHSMLLAIDQLQDAGEEDYSVGMLFNGTLQNDDKVFDSAQDITLKAVPHFSPDKMAWPLIPDNEYKAPLTQAAQQAAPPRSNVDANTGIQMALQNPALLAQVGISPNVMNSINQSGLVGALTDGKLDPQQLFKAGMKCYQSGGCDPIIQGIKKMSK